MVRQIFAAVCFLALGGFGVVRAQPADPAAQNSSPHTQSNTGSTSSVSQADKDFAIKAHQDNLAEIQTGQLAAQRAASNDVKQFAQRLVSDHTKADEQLKQIASKKGISLPDQLDEKHKAEMDRLANLSGAQFDTAFTNSQKKGHQQAMNMFQDESRNGQDPDLKSYASNTISVLQQHDNMAMSLSSRQRGGSPASRERH